MARPRSKPATRPELYAAVRRYVLEGEAPLREQFGRVFGEVPAEALEAVRAFEAGEPAEVPGWLVGSVARELGLDVDPGWGRCVVRPDGGVERAAVGGPETTRRKR